MGSKGRVVFMGSDAIGLPALDSLNKSPFADLIAVISQPDKPVGRGKHLTPNPISAYAREHELELLQPVKPDAALEVWMREQAIDLVVVMAYGHILRQSLLETPPCGFVNLHASILPKYRGASPIQSAIAEGEKETGVTLMRVEPAMDAGAVCAVATVPIFPEDTGATVFNKIAQASAPLLEEKLISLLSGSARFMEQAHEAATYVRKLSKDDGWIDFDAPASVSRNRIQAFDPWPGSFCEHEGNRLKVRGASVKEAQVNAKAGTVLAVGEQGLQVATREGVLCFAQMQRPGGKMLPVEDFLRGYVLEPGSVLKGRAGKSLIRS